jgi:hypothetical protein
LKGVYIHTVSIVLPPELVALLLVTQGRPLVYELDREVTGDQMPN